MGSRHRLAKQKKAREQLTKREGGEKKRKILSVPQPSRSTHSTLSEKERDRYQRFDCVPFIYKEITFPPKGCRGRDNNWPKGGNMSWRGERRV